VSIPSFPVSLGSLARIGIEENRRALLDQPACWGGGAHLISGLGDIGGFRHDDLNVSPPGGMSQPYYTPHFDRFCPKQPIAGGFAVPVGVTTAGRLLPRTGRPRPGPSFNGIAGGPRFDCGFPQTEHTGCSHRTAALHPYSTDGRHDLDTFNRRAGECPGSFRTASIRSSFYSFDGSRRHRLPEHRRRRHLRPPLAAHRSSRRKLLFVPPAQKGDLWLATGSGLFHSTNFGASFTNVGTVTASVQSWLRQKQPPGAILQTLYLSGQVNDLLAIFPLDRMRGATWKRNQR